MRALCSLNLPMTDLKQVALFHIGKRGVVDHIKRHAAAQPRQKRQARFGGTSAKRREVVGTNLRGVAILAGMARPRIVDRDIGAAKAGLQCASSLTAERRRGRANAPPAASKSPRACH